MGELMTDLINDPFYFWGKRWFLIASEGDFRFDPKDYGFYTVNPSSECWQGSYGEYGIKDRNLVLNRLWVCLGWSSDTYYPDLLGKEVCHGEGFCGFDHYYDLNRKLDFDGKLLLGRDVLHDLESRMSFQQAYVYNIVHEFVFRKGKLVNVVNYSKCVSQMRQDMKRERGNYEMPHLIGSSLLTDYKSKAWWMDRYGDLKECIWN